jgi:hypothetical protein
VKRRNADILVLFADSRLAGVKFIGSRGVFIRELFDIALESAVGKQPDSYRFRA